MKDLADRVAQAIRDAEEQNGVVQKIWIQENGTIGLTVRMESKPRGTFVGTVDEYGTITNRDGQIIGDLVYENDEDYSTLYLEKGKI